jgi:opacity protein-like surface antigen
MRRLIWSLCAAGIFPVVAQQTPLALDPVPEQAFTAQSAVPVAEAIPAARAVPVAEGIPKTTPLGASDGEAAFDWWLAQANKPTPFYQKWLQSLFDLVAPGEPYRRDKLVLTLGTSIGYDNNVFYSAINRIESALFGVNMGADYHFGSRRLQLDTTLTGGVNYYENRPGGENDQNFTLKLTLNYQLMPRLALGFRTITSYLSQPEPQLIGGSFQYGGSYFYTDTVLDVSYQLRPRLGISISYDYNALRYEDETINESSGFYQQTVSLSGNWLLTPRTTLILQYRYNPVTYYEAGIGSTGQFLLVGIQQSLSPRLKYKFMFGAEHRALENPAPDSPSSYLGPFAEGTLSYSFAPRSELNGSMRLGTEPSGSTGVTIRQTFRANLGVNHFIGSRLSLGASVGYEKDIYDQPGIEDLTQDIYSATLSLRYQFALYMSVVLSDSYLAVEGSAVNSSYTRNFTTLGLEVTF